MRDSVKVVVGQTGETVGGWLAGVAAIGALQTDVAGGGGSGWACINTYIVVEVVSAGEIVFAVRAYEYIVSSTCSTVILWWAYAW